MALNIIQISTHGLTLLETFTRPKSPSKRYLEEVYACVRSHGGLVIADETFCGFGRAGDAFWGFTAHNVVPDVVTLGKSLGNGHPIAAVVTTKGRDIDAFQSF